MNLETAVKNLTAHGFSVRVFRTAQDAANVESLAQNLTPDATNGAKIFLGLLPIMAVYPFVQKYFVKGIVRGSVKE